VNRLLFPYLEAAVALVRGGVDWERIERAAVEFGMRLGPLAQMDEIGIDVILRAAAAFHRGNPVVPPQSELLLAMFQAGRLGRKSGRGFYDYAQPGQRRLDPAAMELAAAHRSGDISGADDELRMRLFVPLLSSACQLIEGQVVARATDVPLALSGGLRCRGQAGDLAGWVRQVTPAVLREWMQRLELPIPESSTLGRLTGG
jgi:3-hydroxyacyl-CoA dehydrogenase